MRQSARARASPLTLVVTRGAFKPAPTREEPVIQMPHAAPRMDTATLSASPIQVDTTIIIVAVAAAVLVVIILIAAYCWSNLKHKHLKPKPTKMADKSGSGVQV